MAILVIIVVLALSRYGKNLFNIIFKNRKFVVCHLKLAATDFTDEWLVVPNKDNYTQVGKYHYDLNPKYSVLKHKGRLHFILDENNAIPNHLSKDNVDDITFQVQELKTALENRASEFLFAKNKNIALILCAIGFVISLLIAIYAIYTIREISPIISWLYEHPGQIIQIGVPNPTPMPTP